MESGNMDVPQGILPPPSGGGPGWGCVPLPPSSRSALIGGMGSDVFPILLRKLGAHASDAHGTSTLPARASYACARRMIVPPFGLGSVLAAVPA